MSGSLPEGFGILEAVKTGNFSSEAAWVARGAQPAPPICCWVADEGQSQSMGGELAIDGTRMCGVCARGWSHRVRAEFFRGMARTGFVAVWCAMGSLYHVAHGPWQSAKLRPAICSQSSELTQTPRPIDDSLRQVRPRVPAEQPLQRDDPGERVGRVRRERLVANLPPPSQGIADFKCHRST